MSGAGVAIGTAVVIGTVGGGLAWWLYGRGPTSNQLTATISGPTVVQVGSPATFVVKVSGGTLPYRLDFISTLPGTANGVKFTITPTAAGSESIFCNVQDATGVGVTTNTWPYNVTTTSITCGSPDVAENANGTCPENYVPDPTSPGCCKPSVPGSGLIFVLNQQTGSVSVQGDVGLPLYFGATGATANGPVWVAWGNSPSEMYVPIGDASYLALADDYGGLNVTSCVGALLALWESVGTCSGAALTNPFYLALYDSGSQSLSNVLVVTLGSITGKDYCQSNLIPGTGNLVCPPGTSQCPGSGAGRYYCIAEA